MSKLEFFQINLHHSKSAVLELNNLQSTSHQRSIFLVQEPYIKNNKIRNFDSKKFKLFTKVSNDKPRTCILSTNDCELMLLNHLSSGDLTVASAKISMNGGNRVTILASCYVPSEQNILPPSDELINLVSYCKSNNLPLIIFPTLTRTTLCGVAPIQTLKVNHY